MGLFEAFDKVNHQDWIDKILVDLKGKDFKETLVWNSNEGIDVQPFYNSNSIVSTFTPLKKYNSWKIRETIVIHSIKEANRKALLALKGGVNAILFIGEIKDQAEMNDLLNDIQTDIIEIHFYNSAPKFTLELITQKQGSVSYDYLGECLFSGNWNAKENDLKELAEITLKNNTIKTITVNGTNYSNVKYGLVQEIAFSLSQAVEYFNLLTDKGVDANTIASKIQLTYGVGSNYFFEIAKIRATRKLWKLILEQYKVTDLTITIHSETSSSKLSEEDKNYDIIRNTTKAMSAIIGGCDSLTVLPHDTTETSIDFSNRIAKNIQHILKEEAFFDKVNNPADGSYYIEKLTDEIANKALQLFQEVEEQGGFLACIDNGFISNQTKSETIN